MHYIIHNHQIYVHNATYHIQLFHNSLDPLHLLSFNLVLETEGTVMSLWYTVFAIFLHPSTLKLQNNPLLPPPQWHLPLSIPFTHPTWILWQKDKPQILFTPQHSVPPWFTGLIRSISASPSIYKLCIVATLPRVQCTGAWLPLYLRDGDISSVT